MVHSHLMLPQQLMVAMRKTFCSPRDSFLSKDCKGETIWMNPPFDRIDEFLGHYRAQKVKDTSIAGVFVLPQWKDSHWWSKTSGWLEVCTYRKGTDLFTAPADKGQPGGRRLLGPTPWPIVIFYDAPQSSVHHPVGPDSRLEECTPEDDANPEDTTIEIGHVGDDTGNSACRSKDLGRRLLIAKGRINKTTVTMLFDSGAGKDLMDQELATKLGLPLREANTIQLRMAGGQVQTASSTAQVELNIEKWKEQRSFYVTSMQDFDIILGKQWHADHSPQIDWRRNQIQLWKDGQPLRIRATAASKGER